MERYHIYKLAMAILFYVTYCRRSLIASALSTHQTTDGDEYVYYQGVQGKPGVDFPVYARIPRTSFSCKKVESGYYADLETDCQVFHICNGGAKISFLCPNGTIFQQSELICEWWFKVNCTDSPNYYSESAELLREEWWKRKNLRKITQNRNSPATTRRKPKQEFNNNEPLAQNKINNGQRKESIQENIEESRGGVSDSRSVHGKSTESSFTRNINAEARSQSRRKQANGDRGGRKFKQNVELGRNELTENDAESQIPEETASFYKSNRNVIESSDKPTVNRYPNHKETYSEIQDVKLYSTKTTNRFTQTLAPQTYSTNRIPLNDGKPFVISTPKSSYNIHSGGYSSNSNDYNRVTTETFRYSPTVPPFTQQKKPHVTTVIPKIIVDGDASQESSDSSKYENSASTISSPVESQRDGHSIQVSVSDSKTSYGNEYTTPNSIRNYEDRKSITFTERINSFSGLEDIIHTSNVATQKKLHESTNLGSDNQKRPFNNEFETTTRDRYYPSNLKATSNNYGFHFEGNEQNRSTDNKYEITTKDSYYSYEIGTDPNNDTNSKSILARHEATTRDSYYPPVIKSTSTKYGSELSSNAKSTFEVNKYETTTKNVYSSDAVDSHKNKKPLNDYSSQIQNNVPNSDRINLHKGIYTNSIHSSTVRPFNSPTPYSSSFPNSTSSGKESTISSRKNANTNQNSTRYDNENKRRGTLEVVQHNSRVSENKENKVDTSTKQSVSQSSYGDACGDDIVYTEIKKDQIIVGTNKIVIDDTSVPTTETNIIRLTVSNAQLTQPTRPASYGRSSLKPVTDSEIFRLAIKDSSNIEKQNNLLVEKQSGDTGGSPLSYISTTFTSSNTYLPKQTTSYRTSTESYNKKSQTKPNTYLPKGSTPIPFSVNKFSNNKDIFKEDIGHPLLVNIRDNNLKTSAGVPQISEEIQKEFALKPKPFELPPKQSNEFIPNAKTINKKTGVALPDYQVSSARPFSLGPHDYEDNTIAPTLPTPYPRESNKISEHLSNMLNTLREIVNARANGNLTDSPRPGLIIPPSVGPQTLHTLAVYFANALDNISSENVSDELPTSDEAQAINELLTHSTLNRYRELFKDDPDESTGTTLEPTGVAEENNDLDGQQSKTAVTPRVRQLAQVFTKALSSYLDDPDMLKKVLQQARPTEPSLSHDKEGRTDNSDDDELLNYSDADIKPNLPRLSTTTPSPRPTWAYILAPNNSSSYEYNSLNIDSEHLQSADSQSFATQFNNYVKEKHFGKGNKNVESSTQLSVGIKENLPSNHWTASANATKLWQDKLYTNPASINENLNIDFRPVDSQETTGASSETANVNYSLNNLPKAELNSTQVHRILVDIVNSSTDDGNKLKRILSKLNTTQEDFLTKMREVEQNPLTRRLILLLISECGSNITKLESEINSNNPSSHSDISNETKSKLFESSRIAEQDKFTKTNSPFPIYVDPSLKDDDEDTRALHLLNSLYTIASKYGK